MLDPAAKPIFIKYRNALLAIGVDFSDELVTDLIEDCNQNLESRLSCSSSLLLLASNTKSRCS